MTSLRSLCILPASWGEEISELGEGSGCECEETAMSSQRHPLPTSPPFGRPRPKNAILDALVFSDAPSQLILRVLRSTIRVFLHLLLSSHTVCTCFLYHSTSAPLIYQPSRSLDCLPQENRHVCCDFVSRPFVVGRSLLPTAISA